MIYGIWPTSLFDRGTHIYPYVYTIHYTRTCTCVYCSLHCQRVVSHHNSSGLKTIHACMGCRLNFNIYMLQSKSSWIYIHWKYISKVRSFGNFQLNLFYKMLIKTFLCISGQVFKKWYILESVYKNVKETFFF